MAVIAGALAPSAHLRTVVELDTYHPSVQDWDKPSRLVRLLDNQRVVWGVPIAISVIGGFALSIAAGDRMAALPFRGPAHIVVMGLLYSVGFFFGLLSLVVGIATVGAVVYLLGGFARKTWRSGRRLEAIVIVALIPVGLWLVLVTPNG
jgi:hypothetical protein